MKDIKDQVRDRVRHVGIHMGAQCNLNCTYCDRDAILRTAGYLKMTDDDVQHIIDFHKEFLTAPGEIPIDYLTFYGGEPMIWVNIIDKIISGIKDQICSHMKFHIVTNGTYLLENRWFFEKWGSNLMVSLSYDFAHQKEHREAPTNAQPIDIDAILDMLEETNIHVLELYYTFPTWRKDAFSVDNITPIVKLFSRHHNIRKLNILPVRFTYKPGIGMVDFIGKDFPVMEHFQKMKQFIELLYVYRIPVAMDGATDIGLPVIGEKMLHILSPDGFIYNDYVFAEYRSEPARIGKWRDGVELYTFKELCLDKCLTCKEFSYCNDKYYHFQWGNDETLANSQCEAYNKFVISFMTQYINKLYAKRDLLQHVG